MIVGVFGGERVTVRVPQGYGAQVKTNKQSVVFTDKDGVTAITLKFTADSPGAMPDDDALRNRAIAATPGLTNLDMTTCATGYTPAKEVDARRPVTSTLSLQVRHAFVACPEGLVEVICAANESAAADARDAYNAFMSSLRVEAVKKEDPPAAN